MIIDIGGKEIKLSPKEVKTAKKIITNVMTKCKAVADEKRCPTFYHTFLIMMHIMSGDQIEAISPEVISMFADAMSKNEEKLIK